MSHDHLPILNQPSSPTSPTSPTTPTDPTHSTHPMAPGKRRPLPHPIQPIDSSQRPKLSSESRTTRRRRLLFYSFAFLTMLAFSAVLDGRRAAVRDKHPKLQLTLPSGTSLSSINDPQSQPQPDPSALENSHPSLSLRPFGLPSRRTPPNTPPKKIPPVPLQPPTAVAAIPASDSDLPKKDPVLSEQELKDDVDQFIAHVDEEAAADASKSAALNASEPTLPASALVTTISVNASEGVAVEPLAPPALATTPLSTNSTENVRLNSEEHFTSAQKRVKAILDDEDTKHHVDENDLRTLEALALQATRGDCEQKTGSKGGSLFKTDAEAASNIDIERTDPLWGAWCLFMGSYKTDAMRDYVIKQRVLEDKVSAAKLAAETNSTDTNTATSFDPSAPSLDDVLTPEQQSDLRLQTDRIMGHLREYDIRYLAALSLQATFGDCGPYGKQLSKPSRESDEKIQLRILREPLLEQTVTRREGAQWGAWCVFQGKKRTAAASDLSHRLDLLVEQLAKSQAAPDISIEDETEITDETASVGSKEIAAPVKGVT